jgi:hypothetical protein
VIRLCRTGELGVEHPIHRLEDALTVGPLLELIADVGHARLTPPLDSASTSLLHERLEPDQVSLALRRIGALHDESAAGLALAIRACAVRSLAHRASLTSPRSRQ